MLKKLPFIFLLLLLSSGLMRMLATAYADAYTVNKGGSTTSADTVLAGPAQSTAPATCTPNTTWIDNSSSTPVINVCKADGVSYTSLGSSVIASFQQTFNVNNEIANAICGINPLIIGNGTSGIEVCYDPTLGPQIRAFPIGDLFFTIPGSGYQWGIKNNVGTTLLGLTNAGVLTLPSQSVAPAALAVTDAARVYNTSNETITSGATTALTFDTERWDTNALHSTGSNTSRLTCTTAGKVSVGATLVWASAGSATGTRTLAIYTNGSTELATQIIAGSTANLAQEVSTVWSCAAGDYFEAKVTHTLGSNLAVVTNLNNSPEMWLQWLGN